MRTASKAAIHPYDRTARVLHWAVAILVVAVAALGWAMPEAPRNTPTRDLLFVLHRSIGLTILALMLLRAFWRWRNPPPPAPGHLLWIERALAGAVHLGLYAMFFVMPISGYLNAAFAGHPVSIFGLFAIPPLVPESGRLSQWSIAVHLVGQYLVYLFLLAHVGAALFHGVVRRDGVLDRMLPARA